MSDSRQAMRLALLRLAGPAVGRLGQIGQIGASSRLRDSLSPGRAASGRAPRVLLIRPDHLGDVLLASPAAAVLHDALPDAEIDWLVGPWSAEIARRAGQPGDAGESGEAGSAGAAGGESSRSGQRGAVLTLDFPGFTRQPKGPPLEPYAVLWREAAKLRAHQYDAALILRTDHWWGAMLAALAGIPRRFGYAVAECVPFLTDTLPMPTGPHRHAVRANQALARLAGTRLSGQPPIRRLVDPSFPILSEEMTWARTWIDGNLGGPPAVPAASNGTMHRARGPVVALHPGSGAILKNWLPERWAELLAELRTWRQARVILTGGPGDRALVEAVAARLDPRPPTLIGETSIGQLAALFACSDLVLGSDSGPLHLAAATGTPTARLYGPTDTAEFGPWNPAGQPGRHWSVTTWMPCQPCRALVSPPCGAVERPACMQGIGVGAVWDVCRQLLDLGGPDVSDWETPAAARSVDSC